MPYPTYPVRTYKGRLPPSQIFTPQIPLAPPTLKSFDATLFSGWQFATGLVSYWKLDEASGTRNDSFGTNHLTDNNTVTSATGKQGNDAQFTAANSEYLSCASNSTLQMSGNTDFMIACWMKLASNPAFGSSYSLISKDDDAANSRDYTLDYNNGGGPPYGLRFYIKGGATYVAPTNFPLTGGLWYFVVAWYDSSNGQVHLRINDSTTYDSATGATGTDASAAEFRIGAREYAGFADYADTEIDEVAIWKRLLTPAEITALYNSGAGTTYGAGLATLTRLPKKSLTATLAPVAAIIRKITDAGFTATLSFVGSVTKFIRVARNSFTATLSRTGNIATSLIHGGTVFTQSFTATLFQSGGGALATDDFNRGNGALGANWGSVSTLIDLTIVSSQAEASASGTNQANRYTAVSAPNDQYSKVTVKTMKADTNTGIGAAVRMASGAVTFYLIQGNTIETTMFKASAGSFTQLGSTAAASAANDVLEISAVGTTITGKKNGTTIIGPVTDSAIASGNFGVWASNPSAGVINLDNWEGGSPGAGGVVATLSRRTGKALSATKSFTAVQVKKIIDGGFAATLSFVGAISRNIRKNLTAALSFIGTFTKSFIAGGGTVFTQSYTATLSFAGAASRKTAKVFSAAIGGGTYSTTFPATENPISESGRWLNGLATGLDWTNCLTTTNLVTGTQLITDNIYADSTAVLTGTWGPNQTATATVFRSGAAITVPSHEVELRLRSTMTAHGSTGYEVLYSMTTNNYSEIVRWNGALGDFTVLDHQDGIVVGNGDVVKATINGNTITSYLNGSVVATVTDSTFSSGNPGVGFYYYYNTTGTSYGFSSFSATSDGGLTGLLTRRTSKALSATKSLSGAVVRKTLKALSASLSFIGATTKAIRDAGFSATQSFTGFLAASKSFLKSLTATLSFSGALSRVVAHFFVQAFTATLSFTGAFSRRIGKALSATLSFVTTQTKFLSKKITAALSFVGDFVKLYIPPGPQTYFKAFTATLAPTAAQTKKIIDSGFSAALSFVGNLAQVKLLLRVFTATLSSAGTLSRSTSKALSATLSLAASLVRRLPRVFSSTLSSAGSLVKAIRDAGFTATLSFVGNLVGIAVHFFTRAFTATTLFVGTLTRTRTVARVLTATLAFAGAITRRTSKSLGATVNFSATIRKAIRKVLRGTLSFIGFIFRGGAVTVLAGWITKCFATIGIGGSMVTATRAGSQLTVEKLDETGVKIQVTSSQLTVERTK